MNRSDNPPQEPIKRWNKRSEVTSVIVPRFDPHSPHWVREPGRVPPPVGLWAFRIAKSLGVSAVYDPGEEALWFYIGGGTGKNEIEFVRRQAFKEANAWRYMVGRPVSAEFDAELRRQPMRVNPPMLVLGNPGIAKEDANAIKGYVLSMRGQSTARMKADLASRLRGYVPAKDIRAFLKYAVKIKKSQELHRRQMAAERPYDIFEGPASTGRRRRNIAPYALMVVGEKSGKVYSMDTSTGALFGQELKQLAADFANSVHAEEPLLVVKTAEPPFDPSEMSEESNYKVKQRWAKKHAIYRVERERARTHGLCPKCGHYGSDCECHRKNPSMPAPRRYTPKLPTERPATFDEAVNLGRKTGWVMVHGGDPDPRKTEALIKKLRDAKFATEVGHDGSLWVYIGIESYFLGGPRKWKQDVNWAMKVLGLRPAFRDVNPHTHTSPEGTYVDAYTDERLGSRRIRVHDRGERELNPTLGELLPDPAIKAVMKVLNKHRGKPTLHKELVVVLEPHRADLEKKGVLVEYLAYYLEAAFGRQVNRGENPYEPPPSEEQAPDPEFWTGFETDDATEAQEIYDLFQNSGYNAVKQGPEGAESSTQQAAMPGKWIVWVYNHGLRSEKKKIERLVDKKTEWREKKRAEREAASKEEAERIRAMLAEKNAEKIQEILRRQPGGRKPGDLWARIKVYGPDYQQTGTAEDWEAWRQEFERDRSCLEANGYEVAWTRDRIHGYHLWAWIGTEEEILSAPDVEDAFNRRREGIYAALVHKCWGGKETHGLKPIVTGAEQYRESVRRWKAAESETELPGPPISRWMERRDQNPPTTARQKNWEPQWWYKAWSGPIREATDAIHNAIYGPYSHKEYPGMPKWSREQTEHPTEWDKLAVRKIVDARNYLRAKATERKHLGDTLANILFYTNRDFVQAKRRGIYHGIKKDWDEGVFQRWKRRVLRYAEAYFLKSRPDPEFVGPLPSQHPWRAFPGHRETKYSPHAREIYRRVNWPKLISYVYKSVEEAIKDYEASPQDVATNLFNKAFQRWGSTEFGRGGGDEGENWTRAVAHTPQTRRNFEIALERVMDEIESGDIVVEEQK